MLRTCRMKRRLRARSCVRFCSLSLSDCTSVPSTVLRGKRRAIWAAMYECCRATRASVLPCQLTSASMTVFNPHAHTHTVATEHFCGEENDTTSSAVGHEMQMRTLS
ncbi:uncharacterized protein B0H18DRAFT_51282 [Fomitopsis serialis]|uniref:uncharacterized protein n=1 Tax=Fomitopsis serialis TaxID=139415 RepID=UPI002007549B|nr:uncharacterized protein B0H18DRAFT_51282 [Neoantrodia serialis]KAH9932232.1 hypothetical protein B0H18DRAFT_51282 [Neoantrodia serialis]